MKKMRKNKNKKNKEIFGNVATSLLRGSTTQESCCQLWRQQLSCAPPQYYRIWQHLCCVNGTIFFCNNDCKKLCECNAYFRTLMISFCICGILVYSVVIVYDYREVKTRTDFWWNFRKLFLMKFSEIFFN